MRNISEEKVYAERVKKGLIAQAKPFKLIDLFAGAGGMTLGFTRLMGHDFETVWANDIDSSAVQTYNRNFGKHCMLGDINTLIKKEHVILPKADVVIGGPPCQGFSLLNKNRHGDHRNQLWRPFLDIVRQVEAKVFVMENVPQLLGSPEYNEIVAVARAMGFRVSKAKLCAADFGVPQTRWRAFIIGSRYADPSLVFPPKKTHYNQNNGLTPSLLKESEEYISAPAPWKTVRKAIGNLPEPVGSDLIDIDPPLNLHFGRKPTRMSLKRYKVVSKQGMNRFDLQRLAPELTPACWIRKTSGGTDLFGRLWWDKPAFTIRTEFFKPEKGRYLHPAQHRPITHREAARLQSFPDEFIFTGSKIDIARQIGNAVPPLLAARVADCVYTLLMLPEVESERRIFATAKK